MLLRFCLLVLWIPSALFGSHPASKTAFAVRTLTAPHIDGKINEQMWIHAEPLIDFHQYEPFFNAPAGQKTEVRFLYDDRALYIGARLFDVAPDSILTQLGNRDDELNADFFSVQFDTYSNGLDAYIFEVYASGVQRDSRRSDETFNAVWESSVFIDHDGWSLEIRIPWSAIRFPVNVQQVWGIQILRSIRRSRELIQWALVPKGVSNTSVYWGQLHGLSDINPPLRLSFTPFVSAHIEHYPFNLPGISNYSEGFSGGLDLKYGINQGFTLDMTLMPDFSTVATDREIKNLSAFETVYDENRGFFKEGVDLFMKGDLFYTRRIGRKPQLYDYAVDKLKDGEFLHKNPDKAQLINAAKVSGRTNTNLGIGIFNAMTANTYAIAKDSTGAQRSILTEPFTNYSIVVMDQGLNSNSAVYLINTNVTRSHGFNNENVTATGITYYEKSNRYRFNAAGRISQIFIKYDQVEQGQKNTDIGYRYTFDVAKVKGKFQFKISFDAMDSKYSINGLGLNHRNDQFSQGTTISYTIYEPFWRMLNLSSNLTMTDSYRMSTGKNTERSLLWRTNGIFRSYLWIWAGLKQSLYRSFDYYEPRTAGRFYLIPLYTYTFFSFSSDYRKPFALDGGIEYTINEDNYTETALTINPIIRFSDRLTMQYRVSHSIQKNDPGFVEQLAQDVIFGKRELKTIENTISSRYMFRNNLSLSLWMRHYWFRGNYNSFYSLSQDGRLIPKEDYVHSHDFNFNTLNVDMLFEWEFSPGSNLGIVFKNAIMKEEAQVSNNFFDNLEKTLEASQLNSITVRFLYYIDYHMFRKYKNMNII